MWGCYIQYDVGIFCTILYRMSLKYTIQLFAFSNLRPYYWVTELQLFGYIDRKIFFFNNSYFFYRYYMLIIFWDCGFEAVPPQILELDFQYLSRGKGEELTTLSGFSFKTSERIKFWIIWKHFWIYSPYLREHSLLSHLIKMHRFREKYV